MRYSNAKDLNFYDPDSLLYEKHIFTRPLMYVISPHESAHLIIVEYFIYATQQDRFMINIDLTCQTDRHTITNHMFVGLLSFHSVQKCSFKNHKMFWLKWIQRIGKWWLKILKLFLFLLDLNDKIPAGYKSGQFDKLNKLLTLGE